jgi:hypothetical protein
MKEATMIAANIKIEVENRENPEEEKKATIKVDIREEVVKETLREDIIKIKGLIMSQK